MRILLLTLLFFSAVFAENRIVTLSPAINEIVFALGCGKEVAGATQYADFPKDAQNIPRIGGYNNISIEKIASLHPTLVIAETSDKEVTNKLERLGIKTASVNTDSLNNIKLTILDIGAKLNKTSEAKSIVANIDKELQRLELKPRTNQKMLIVFGVNVDITKNVYVAGNNLYFGELIKKSGFKNAVNKPAQPILGLEGIIACNPDIIIILFPYAKEQHISTEQIKASWSALPIKAAKSGAIFVLKDDYVSIPSNRIVLLMQDLEKIIDVNSANLQ